MGEVIRFPFEERVRAVRRERLKNGALRDLEDLFRAAAHGKVSADTANRLMRNAVSYGATNDEMVDLAKKHAITEENFYTSADVEDERTKNARKMGYARGMGFVGSKNERSRDVKEVAKMLRKDIKAAIKSGELPKGLKTSVRISRFSGGCSLRVTVKSLPADFPLLNPERVEHEMHRPHTYCGLPRYTGEGRRLVSRLEAMMNAYNRDNSDSMTDYFDVDFYGFVGVDTAVESAARETLVAALA